MSTFMVRSISILAVVIVSGCARSHLVGGELREPASVGLDSEACEAQMESSQDGLPVDLACTGLYKNLEDGTLGEGVESFQPAYALWSDGAGKTRWLKLPDGEQIDTSDPRSWRFPVQTKLWKEFRADGARVETRYFEKVREDRWVKTTFIWNDRGSKATRHDTGMELTRNDVDYVVPDSGKCNDCHDGHPDNVLGFEAVSLGLPASDAEGWTLQKLIDEDRLTDPPEQGEYTIGDDGTGKAAAALGWLHINCGVTCHNDGVNSKAEVTNLRMKLDPATLDGRPSNEFQTRQLLVNVPAVTTQWQGQKRIVPGKPDESLLYKLITTRLGIDGNNQMPPLATRLVDEENVAKIRDWILAMPAAGDEVE
jgi:hypothetical protein